MTPERALDVGHREQSIEGDVGLEVEPVEQPEVVPPPKRIKGPPAVMALRDISHAPVMAGILKKAHLVALTDAIVSIGGESGTGKEVLARAVHNTSRRRTQAFVIVNCGAIPPGLIDTELFGFTRGAFTGAVTERPGQVFAANGGTLFLDEIGELPLDSQTRLLRLLQEKTFVKVGGTGKEIQADVRIIAATNKDLALAVQQGRFREDLFFRLNVFPINLPTLRERMEDIPELSDHLLHRIVHKNSGGTLAGFTAAAREHLARYPWPGNVRELENAIEFAWIMSEGEIIKPEHLPDNVRNNVVLFSASASQVSGAAPNQMSANRRYIDRYTPDGRTLREAGDIELETLEGALRDLDYNQRLTAEALRISRRSISLRLKRLRQSVRRAAPTPKS